MSIELVTVLLFGTMMLTMLTGIPLAFALGSVGLAFALILTGPASLNLIIFTTMIMLGSFIFVAIPLFLFMGFVLERSGIADDLYEFFHHWMGPLRGGLAVGTVMICCIFAAMCGVSGAATVSMGLIALPSMLKRGYDKHIAVGTIQAGGALGFLIPPSVVMIIYGLIAKVSIGQLFMGGVLPGLLLATLFMIYIVIRCYLQPHMGPVLEKEERVSWADKIKLLRGLILPALLVFCVLGTIFMGICSPTEAAGIGASGSLVCAAIKRRLTWKVFHEATVRTGRVTAMIIWIAISAIAFSTVYNYLGAPKLVENLLSGITTSPFGILLLIQLSFFIMGMFLDDTAILFICMPIYVPIIKSQGFDPVWFGVLYVVNMQMAFITPPFGYTLFYMKAVVPKGITIGDIYLSVIPFVTLQAVGLLIIMIFPQLVLWLPRMVF